MPPAKKTRRRDAGRPRGEPVEAAILARTLEELSAHGIDGVSVERIARAAQVNKTSIYRRFPTREGLVAAALERVATDIGRRLDDQGSLRQDLELVADQVTALLKGPLGRSLARAAFAGTEESPLAALAARRVTGARGAALAMVERARARGEWRDGIAPEVLLAALVGALLHRALLERAPLTRAFRRQVVELVVAGVTPRRSDTQ